MPAVVSRRQEKNSMEQEIREKSITKPEISSIAISCNTYKRPDFLKMCLEGIGNLSLPESIRIEVIVVDNDTEASGRAVVEQVSKNFPLKINYFVEEKRGLSNARNRLLKEAVNGGFSHIALLDDDDVADTNWLLELVDLYRKDDRAYIIAGPQYAQFLGEFPDYLTNNNIFVKSTTKKKGEIRKICATNNVFLPTELVSEANVWFDPSFVFMGGEDGDFFTRAGLAGYTIVFNPDAIVREINDKGRVNLRWIFNRCYYNGYSASFLKFKEKNSALKRTMYIVKSIIICLLDILLIPFSLIKGLTGFFNALGILCKNYGKLKGAVVLKSLNYYQNLNGRKHDA